MKFSRTTITWVVAALFAVFSASALSAPPAHSKGKGTPPTRFIWLEVFGDAGVFVFPFISCPAFETEMTLTISGFWIFHPAKPGKDEFEFYHSAVVTEIANADDPSIKVEGIPGQVLNRHWTGTPFASDPIETGVQLMITLPGHGVIYRDVGRARFDIATFDPVFFMGHWDSLDGDFQALCAALAP